LRGHNSIWRLAIIGALAFFPLAVAAAGAAPSLVVDVDSGNVLSAQDATEPWFPASLTKLMTAYVALAAVRDGRLTMDTPLIVSPRATRVPPSRMGFKPGTQVTLDNALKMLMVHSPNDVAITVAEGVSGSVEAFANEMNATAAKFGLRESHFVNPNGLHDAQHVSSARDMAIIARALLRDFPEHADLFDIGAIELDNRIYPNHNGLMGRYDGANGMKTGFTCPAGFNVVASAARGGRRLIAVVLGSPSARLRTDKAAELLDAGFSQWGGGLGQLESLPGSGVAEAPNMRDEICTRRNRQAVEEAEAEIETSPTRGLSRTGSVPFFWGAVPQAQPQSVSDVTPQPFDPIPVFIGPKDGWTGVALGPRPPGTTPDPATANATPGGSTEGQSTMAKAGVGASPAFDPDSPLALAGSQPSISEKDLPPKPKAPAKAAAKVVKIYKVLKKLKKHIPTPSTANPTH